MFPYKKLVELLMFLFLLVLLFVRLVAAGRRWSLLALGIHHAMTWHFTNLFAHPLH